MKKTFALLFFCSFSMAAFAQQPLNVMTFNVRLNVASDSMNAWPYRQKHVASQVLFYDVEILGVQEALPGQIGDLEDMLANYNYIGVGREPGNEGEFSAIFYDTNRLKALSYSTFWLSETPRVPGSKSWDAAITRIVTWGKFLDKTTGASFYVFNTHFDHIGKEARKHSAQIILHAVDSLAGKYPVIVMGDFNTTPNNPPYQIITDKNNPNHLTDTKEISKTPHFGPTGTFNAFKKKETSDLPIDFIFVKNGIDVLKHATLSQTWEGRFSSDHFPVMARLVIPDKW